MPGAIVDIGTGDGKFAYQVAKDNPDRFVIGIDSNQKNLEKSSARVYKKSAKGGLKNALFVLASIENLPQELNGVANQVFINLPWGSLLQGIVEAEKPIWDNLKRICQPGARIDILLNENENLNLETIRGGTSPKLEAMGLKVEEVKGLSADDLKKYPSSWAKRLVHGKPSHFVQIKILIKKPEQKRK